MIAPEKMAMPCFSMMSKIWKHKNKCLDIFKKMYGVLPVYSPHKFC